MAERWWLYPMQLAGPAPVAAVAAATRTHARPALQTSAALVAVALALDVSAASEISPFQLDEEFAPTAVATALRVDEIEPLRPWDLGGVGASWSSAASADGWFV